MCICVITSYYCKVMVGLETQFCTLLEVWGVRGLGIRMLTLDMKTFLYVEDRGFQVPMLLEHLLRPDPRVRERISIGTILPIRVDYTDFFQVAIKTHSIPIGTCSMWSTMNCMSVKICSECIHLLLLQVSIVQTNLRPFFCLLFRDSEIKWELKRRPCVFICSRIKKARTED